MAEWNMDKWKYFDITHRDHTVLNPLSLEKLDEFIALLDLNAGSSVLDVACGKAEMLVRIVEKYGAKGVGLDLSPPFIEACEANKRERVPDSDLRFIEIDGVDYKPNDAELFDVASCIGATWIWGGYRGTLRALKSMVKPGGLVAVGEPYFMQPPHPDYLAIEGFDADAFNTHRGNVVTGEGEGLTYLYSIVSNADDWDRYEGLQYRAAVKYARSNPEDPDLPEITARVSKSRDAYLRWGRDTLGWAVYLFQTPEVASLGLCKT